MRKFRPVGQPTRGKTARNRLRRVDNFLSMYDPSLIRCTAGNHRQAFFVDLGYGAEPYTTLESAARLRRLNPRLPVLGVEIDAERVERALPFADAATRFRLGGFNLPLQPGETARIVRAFNVLRQYDEVQVRAALETLRSGMMEGGLIVEGTSDPYGRVWTANLLRRRHAGLQVEGLVFSTNFRWGFEPGIFQPVLPKNHIHRMQPGELIHEFMESWKRAALETIAYRDFGLRRWFAASARRLAVMGYPVALHPRWINHGFLLWKTDRLQ